MHLIISLIAFSLLVTYHTHVNGHEHHHPHSHSQTTPDDRMWPERWQSSWMFIRTDPAVIPNNTNELITAYGNFYYDWSQQRALFTHSRCPAPLPSETDFNDYPCDTLFLGSSIYLVAYNTSNDTKSCCKWYNPWNATVTSPDWMIRGDATYLGTSTRTGMKTKVWAGVLPFRWEYGILADPRTKNTVPHFLDLYDTPENQHIVTRWLTPDAIIVDSFDESLFQLPDGVSCDSQCQMDVPFPVPAPDAVRYPHVAGVMPSTSAAVSSVEAMYAAQTPHAHLHANSHVHEHGIIHHASCPFAHQSNRIKYHKRHP